MMMKTFKDWLAKKNEPFSLIGGENFTNKEIVLAHVYVVALVAACCLAEYINSL